MTTDTSEKGLELIIVSSMTGLSREEILRREGQRGVSSNPAPLPGLCNWLLGDAKSYRRDHCVDLDQLSVFLLTTQPRIAAALDLAEDTPVRREFLARLASEIGRRGIVDVLRKGISHRGHDNIALFYASPSAGNEEAVRLHALNRFSVSRQLRYSADETRRALDLVLFVNGLPFATFELKNSLTKQNVADAILQYQRDRDPREPLFALGRCAVHFAVDDDEVRMCTELAGKESWFLPLNKGFNDGAGNPPNPHGLKTDYLWKLLLAPQSLTEIIENYAQIVEETDRRTGRKKRKQIFPRYHQLDVVRTLLADAARSGAGRRRLIQHSAGSGKSNSIAWLAHQLIGVEKDGRKVFDSIIVVTDRRILDKQIRDTIRQFAQVAATVAAVTEGSQQLRQFIESGKKIIISTVQKFPMILDAIGDDHRDRTFAVIIDEAHSSQGGQTATAMTRVLANDESEEEEEDDEDRINAEIERRVRTRKLAKNASYFAFTATPKNKTLEIFGKPLPPGPDGKTPYAAHHVYTMKQAIQEGFILDVLQSFTPVKSYYGLVKKIEGDPEFETRRARKKLRKYVESHDHAIRLKAEIMVDHFHEQVLDLRKIGGEARAMVVTSGVPRAIQYFHEIRDYLRKIKSPHQAIVAFSGEREYGGVKVTEASLNGFPSSEIAERIQAAPYRFLICADKFQTGYDEPLLHTMYVDKPLSSVKAVQTLSRLNRAHPKKHDVFVLDFMNEAEGIQKAFEPYYRTTLLAEETDPNKLHDLKSDVDSAEVYAQSDVDEVVALYLSGADRDRLDPIVDACIARYLALDEDGQVDFKSKAKAFARTYEFLGSILPYTNAGWERLSIFLNLLIRKLPAPKEEDLARGILEAIDMDSYRAEKKAAFAIQLPDADATVAPVPVEGGGRKPEPEFDRLSNIVKSFNEQFGTLFDDGDRVIRRFRDDIAPKVAADEAFQNAKRNTPHTAKLEYERALERATLELMKEDIEIYRQFMQNESFKRFVKDMVFDIVSEAGGP